jgi:hypothetical protein
MADPKAVRVMANNSGINVKNVIVVGMEDLLEKDQNNLELELQWEMEKVMAERWKKKLACIQKMRGGVIKKGDTMRASRLVNSHFMLKELIHMINVSSNSKYGTDLESITHTLMDGLRESFESFKLECKQDFKNLPKQVRSMVQKVLGEVKGKREDESPDTNTMITYVSPTNTGRMGNQRGCQP